MTKSVFITGLAGFLGSHIADRMLSKGYRVVGCDNLIGGYLDNIPKGTEFHQVDCNDLDEMKRITKGIDIIYHTAATAYEGLSVFSPHIVTKHIVGASTGVFTAAAANKCKRVISCSSMARYGTNVVPFTEDMTPKPQDPYGIGKVCAEMMLKNLCEVHGMEWVIAVPHNIIGPRQRYCLHPDSLVKTVNGLCKISSCREQQALTTGKPSYIIDSFQSKNTDAKKIVLSNGHTITCGIGHKFLTLENLDLVWKEAKNIKEGDSIIYDNGIGTNIDRKNKDYKLGQFYGLLLADGTCNDKYQASIACCIEEDKPQLRKLLNELEYKFVENKRGCFNIYSVSFLKELHDIGFGDTGRNKFIPVSLLSKSWSCTAGIISGLLSGDGWITKDGKTVGFANTSQKLVQQVQEILLSIGINSHFSIRERPPTGEIEGRTIYLDGPIYYLTISGSNVDRFKEIGFLYNRKDKTLYDKKLSKPSNVFHKLGVSIKRLGERLPLAIRKCNCINTPREDITTFSLSQLVSALEVWLKSNTERDQIEYFTFIKKITEKLQTINSFGGAEIVKCINSCESELWDITIDSQEHCYVGAGVLSHNCDPFRNVASIMINLMLQGRQPIVYSDGQQKRCFSFIQDDIDILEKLIEADNVVGEIINIGPDEEFVTILELAETIADLLNFDLKPTFMPGRPQEVKLANCSANKARRLLGYSTQWSLRDGLAVMIDYIKFRGPKPFDYHLELEIINEKTPRTWKDKLF